ncbi:MAG: orotate phosphoribosyltransferase [Gemmatimonadetes bacterium]|nr:orotate phosphoribosyltransferase [Gemmatimonadota bacterium]MBI2615615.1 orotate phosphoribosyltransferase [Gemmatimonadota bacterium]MBI3081972.1 orotate phosphoribosyltransferase [Gemmatimonadota bacterium]
MSATDANLHARLVALLRERSVQRGSFTLASGRSSSYYIDARITTMSAAGLLLVGELGLHAIRRARWEAELVGGLTMGADPVAYAIARASSEAPPVLDAFSVRTEIKGHGAGRRIEGCFRSGARVVVVEDVITSGQSALTAIGAVREAGGSVSGVLAVVDRDEGGRAAIERAGVPVLSLVSVRDLGVA